MRKNSSRLKTNIRFYALIVILIAVLSSGGKIQNTVKETFINCLTVVLPPMFPAMIITTLLSQSKIPEYPKKILVKISTFFGFHEDVTIPFFMGMFSGYPTGIKNVMVLYEKKLCSGNSAKKIAMLIVNPGIVYSTIVIGKNTLNSRLTGFMLYLSISFSQLIAAKIFNKNEEHNVKKIQYDGTDFFQALVNSVSFTGNSLFNITLWITAFGIVSYFVKLIPCHGFENYILLFSDVTNLTSKSLDINSVPLFAFALGFGGLCVICQLLPELKTLKLKISEFFFMRLLIGLLSALIMKVFLLFIPVSESACSGTLQTMSLSQNSFSGFLSVIFFTVIFMFGIANRNELC